MFRTDKNAILRMAAMAILGWYLMFAVLHLAGQRPLWNDELCVFRSIEAFKPHQMFGQQLYDLQVFPRLYLFIIQQFSQQFDFHLISLRLLPFVAMIGAIFLWLRIAEKELRDPLLYLGFILSWAASAPLIYYAAELKQYSMDALAAAIVLTFLYKQKELKTQSRYRFILFLLPWLGLLSYPVWMLLVLPAYDLIRNARLGARSLGDLLLYGAVMASVLSISYFFDMRWRPIADVTSGFGDYFVSVASPMEFIKTASEGINNLFSRVLIEQPKALKRIARIFLFGGFIYMIYGFIRTFRSQRKEGRPLELSCLEVYGVIIFAESFLLGLLKKYPFTVPRTSLFFMPIILILTLKGIHELRKIHPLLSRGTLMVYYGFLGYVSLGLAQVVWRAELGAIPKIWM